MRSERLPHPFTQSVNPFSELISAVLQSIRIDILPTAAWPIEREDWLLVLAP
jgi:hypothetical protein